MATSGPTLGQAAAKQAAEDKARALRLKKDSEQRQKERAAERHQRQAERDAGGAMQVLLPSRPQQLLKPLYKLSFIVQS